MNENYYIRPHVNLLFIVNVARRVENMNEKTAFSKATF